MKKRTLLCGFLCLLTVWPVEQGAAQNPPEQMRLDFRPHCETGQEVENVFGGPLPESSYLISTTNGRCPPFAVRDPSSRKTDELEEGDILDIDIVADNPGREDVSRFRAWIAYDPSILQGMDVAISPAFPDSTPGESDFAPTEGYVKISGDSQSPIDDAIIPLARIRFRVLASTAAGTPLTLADILPTTDSHTGVFGNAGGQEVNFITQPQGYLYVKLLQPDTQSASSQDSVPTVSQSSVAPTSMPSESVSSATDPFAAFRSSNGTTFPGDSGQSSSMLGTAVSASSIGNLAEIFSLLRVQGLRVGTEGSTAYLAWDALASMQLAGYNVYYGTVSGRYLQRRSVDKAATSLVIRNLPEGTVYYFAIRAVNTQGEESDFSNEVSVTIGQPSTSTSPLGANMLPTPTPGSDGNISGDTGPGTMLALLLALSAVIGTVLAFRRQLSPSPTRL